MKNLLSLACSLVLVSSALANISLNEVYSLPNADLGQTGDNEFVKVEPQAVVLERREETAVDDNNAGAGADDADTDDADTDDADTDDADTDDADTDDSDASRGHHRPPPPHHRPPPPPHHRPPPPPHHRPPPPPHHRPPPPPHHRPPPPPHHGRPNDD
ncbi:hypothetical protein K501DRAFT_270277 [Backusella circina FSU 941]|nr:hypothetical protein K501DRAFT_270277 [Backusella circina FSU 941]